MNNIVVCGSMKVKDKIMEVYDILKGYGYNVLLPLECLKDVPKNIASRAHFDRISDSNNDIILIVNDTKKKLLLVFILIKKFICLMIFMSLIKMN